MSLDFAVFDIFTAAIVVLSSVFACYHGFIKFITGLVVFVCSIVLAYFLHHIPEEVLRHYIKNQALLEIIAAIVSYIIALITLSIIKVNILNVLGDIKGGFIDRCVGFLAGFIRGAFLAFIIFINIAIISTASYKQAQNFYDVIDNIDKEEYPKWLQGTKSAMFFDNLKDDMLARGIFDFMRSFRFDDIKNIKHDIKSKYHEHDDKSEKRGRRYQNNLENDIKENNKLSKETNDMLESIINNMEVEVDDNI